MKNETRPNPLLDDVLEEVAPAEFRAELFAQTISKAKQRNLFRRLNQTVMAIAVLAVFGLASWKPQVTRNKKVQQQTASLNKVASAPLELSQVIETVPGAAPTFRSSSSTVTVIETSRTLHYFQELDDAGLLELLAGTPSVLVRQGPGRAELLIVDAASSSARPVDDTYQRNVPYQ